MRIILLGPPGSGKGTQAKNLSQSLKIPIISVGDILRISQNKKTIPIYELNNAILHGKLISDSIIIKLVRMYIQKSKYQKGFILDGFPRTLEQAKATKNFNIDYVISLIVDNKTIINRISGRRIHLPSGRIYHIFNNPPKNLNRDDITGELLTQRQDDNEKIIKNRLLIYKKKTQPLIFYYTNKNIKNKNPKYIEISGIGLEKSITANILKNIYTHKKY